MTIIHKQKRHGNSHPDAESQALELISVQAVNSTDAQGVSMALYRKKQPIGTASTILPPAIRYPTGAKLPEFFHAGCVGVFDDRWHSVAIVSD